MDSSSSSEHPIEQARREYEDGYRAYLGRTHYLMKDLREQAEPVVEDEQPEERPEPLPGESGAADVFMDLHERATSDLPELGVADVLWPPPGTLTEAEYLALEGFNEQPPEVLT
jgi:hypothetical protein